MVVITRENLQQQKNITRGECSSCTGVHQVRMISVLTCKPMEWDTLQVSDSAPVGRVSGTGIKMQP